MCRKGRMFAPTKTWRRWHRKINVNQRRYAVASALAASALPSLVMARGHRIDEVAEVPLVVSSDRVKDVNKTNAAVKLLKELHAFQDVSRAKESTKIRAGKGKLRNRRYVTRRGPLVVHDTNEHVSQAFRNLPGVELAHVERLNLLQLAPGGHLGRFVIWTQRAFARLDSVWGTQTRGSAHKTGYHLPRAVVSNPDITRIINSDEVQSKLRPAQRVRRFYTQKKNPLRNVGVLFKLNPYAKTVRRRAALAQLSKEERAKVVARKRKTPAKKQVTKAKPKTTATKQKKKTQKSHAKFHKLLLA
jgi:large subunit ribosomal protein L4e